MSLTLDRPEEKFAIVAEYSDPANPAEWRGDITPRWLLGGEWLATHPALHCMGTRQPTPELAITDCLKRNGYHIVSAVKQQ